MMQEWLSIIELEKQLILVKTRFEGYKDTVSTSTRNLFLWIKAISNVLKRKTRNLVRTLTSKWTTFSDEVLLKEIIDPRDDTV